MPLAGKVSGVTVLLIELGDGRCLFLETIGVAGNDDDRQRRTDRDTPGYERCAARGAAGLAVPIGEHGTFLGEAINVRRRVAECRSTEVGTEIAPSGVVAHQHDDVGLFFCCAAEGVAATVIAANETIRLSRNLLVVLMLQPSFGWDLAGR